MPKVKVNAKGVPVRRLAGLVLSDVPAEMDVTEEQLKVLQADDYVNVSCVAEAEEEEEPTVFGRKASEWKPEDEEELRALAKGKGNTKEGKLAKAIIAGFKKADEE